MKLKDVQGKFVRKSSWGVAQIWFVRNIYKNGFHVVIQYLKILYGSTKADSGLMGSTYQQLYTFFQSDITSGKERNGEKIEIIDDQERWQRDFIIYVFMG
jgi:hypothetical protein